MGFSPFSGDVDGEITLRVSWKNNIRGLNGPTSKTLCVGSQTTTTPRWGPSEGTRRVGERSVWGTTTGLRTRDRTRRESKKGYSVSNHNHNVQSPVYSPLTSLVERRYPLQLHRPSRLPVPFYVPSLPSPPHPDYCPSKSTPVSFLLLPLESLTTLYTDSRSGLWKSLSFPVLTLCSSRHFSRVLDGSGPSSSVAFRTLLPDRSASPGTGVRVSRRVLRTHGHVFYPFLNRFSKYSVDSLIPTYDWDCSLLIPLWPFQLLMFYTLALPLPYLRLFPIRLRYSVPYVSSLNVCKTSILVSQTFIFPFLFRKTRLISLTPIVEYHLFLIWESVIKV